MDYLSFHFYSTRDWSPRSKSQLFFELISSLDPKIKPTSFLFLKRQQQFSPENKADFLTGWETCGSSRSVYLKNSNNGFWLQATYFCQEALAFNTIVGGVKRSYSSNSNNLAGLLSFFNQIFDWGEMCYGYVCDSSEFRDKNCLQKPIMIHGKLTATGGLDLRESIPGIYWLNYFGPPYVSWFGKKKLEDTHGFEIKVLNNSIRIQSFSSPFVNGEKEYVNTESIINYLGRECFFEKKHPKKKCKTPEFVFEQKCFNNQTNNTAFEVHDWFIPNAQEFIDNTKNLIQSLTKRLKNKESGLDLSAKSLNIIDQFIVRKSNNIPEPWKQDIQIEIIRELTAYYGETIRKNLGGSWGITLEGHPCINFQGQQEIPLLRVVRLWIDKEKKDGLVVRYTMLQKGMVGRVENYLKKILHR